MTWLIAGGCGGDGAERAADRKGTPLTIGTTQAEQPPARIQTRHFSFATPRYWERVESVTQESFGADYLLSGTSVAPRGSGPNSLVIVAAYDFSAVADRVPWKARDFARTYTAAVDGTIFTPPRRFSIHGGPGDVYVVAFKIDGVSVHATVVRLLRKPKVFIIQCQAEIQDFKAIDRGCLKILKSFQIRSRT